MTGRRVGTRSILPREHPRHHVGVEINHASRFPGPVHGCHRRSGSARRYRTRLEVRQLARGFGGDESRHHGHALPDRRDLRSRIAREQRPADRVRRRLRDPRRCSPRVLYEWRSPALISPPNERVTPMTVLDDAQRQEHTSLTFHGEVLGKRQHYYVRSSAHHYFVMSVSSRKRAAGNFDRVGKSILGRLRRRLRGQLDPGGARLRPDEEPSARPGGPDGARTSSTCWSRPIARASTQAPCVAGDLLLHVRRR